MNDMYKIGHRKKNIKHHFYILSTLILATLLIATAIWWYLSQTKKPTIVQTAPSNQQFNLDKTLANVKIDNALYTLELPNGWKQTSINRDTRYDSTQWQMQNGSKNRWIELYTDRIPTDTAFNKILPVSIQNNEVIIDTLSDNCSKFTNKINDTNLKVISKWQNAPFLCDLSNMTDNIIGVSDKTSGVGLSFTGTTTGKHTFMFVYTDRGIPEDEQPIKTALQTLAPK
jgi:hypothetical protein